MLLVWLVQGAFAAPLGCAEVVDADVLAGALGRAEAAVSGFDAAVLEDAVAQASDAVRCLGTPADRELLARFWRARGVVAFGDRDDGRASAAFAAARALDPAMTLDPVLSGPIATLFANADLDEFAAPLPPPPSGDLYVDGRPARAVPQRRSSLVQWVDGAEVRQSWLVSPGDALPVLAVATLPAPAPVLEPSAGRPSRGLLVAGLAAGLAGGLAAGGAAVTGRSYLDSDAPPDEVRGALGLNRALSLSSYGLFAGAAGLGVAAVVVGRW